MSSSHSTVGLLDQIISYRKYVCFIELLSSRRIFHRVGPARAQRVSRSFFLLIKQDGKKSREGRYYRTYLEVLSLLMFGLPFPLCLKPLLSRYFRCIFRFFWSLIRPGNVFTFFRTHYHVLLYVYLSRDPRWMGLERDHQQQPSPIVTRYLNLIVEQVVFVALLKFGGGPVGILLADPSDPGVVDLNLKCTTGWGCFPHTMPNSRERLCHEYAKFEFAVSTRKRGRLMMKLWQVAQNGGGVLCVLALLPCDPDSGCMCRTTVLHGETRNHTRRFISPSCCCPNPWFIISIAHHFIRREEALVANSHATDDSSTFQVPFFPCCSGLTSGNCIDYDLL